ncbi:MAG: hypothetical protein QNL70_06405 [Pseudomonas sp.]|uniref:Secreted protein n=2 Tax=Halopseudomonas TaxID=2901189 RepID=A0A4V5NKM8_9GAMM|nr:MULTISPECIES: hypothetical protein [Halopseudomonas]TKA91627.1 hypothetical protein FA869_11105 [Halopseudomonas bauzanensis]SDT03923.1 hypothetical protein SAMN05216198_3484 [Halopseudomonas litoralis]
MKTITTIFALLFSFTIAATAHAEDGSMRYREMVEDLREQNKERSEAKQSQKNEEQITRNSEEESDSTKKRK